MPLVQIDTARLTLRPFLPDDAEPYYQAVFSDPDVMRYLPGGKPLPMERVLMMHERVRAHWASHGFGLWAVTLREDHTLIGHCGIQRLPDVPDVELAYAIAKPYWGRGLVTEAARASLRFGFERIGLERIMALAVPENTASRRVMEKVGMTYTGMAAYYGTELACYVLSRSEYQAAAAPYTLTVLLEENKLKP
ncbi:MAG TPA: GNAT family N-acetyltransferase [Aggregatilinea sp.]|uniref:GNAT family N-acetyltransferase n=1 Tax=Aggregatilinea sp. TaxID=2806333 RepID=UPI002C76725A|nr:GNAT family N-acetyltransferase [Aggregatilinea sp.]HML24013.1 GNAT family N-acetyltransferase [Aggregatilinea sp.]